MNKLGLEQREEAMKLRIQLPSLGPLGAKATMDGALLRPVKMENEKPTEWN